MTSSSPLPFALCAFSLPHVMGYLPTKAGEKVTDPLTPLGLMDAARDLGLAGVEFPLMSLVPSFDGALVQTQPLETDIRAELQARGLKVVAAYGALLDNDAQHLRNNLALAAAAGAKVMRVTLSHVLCGDRRKLAGGWEAHREALAARLNEVLPYAEEVDVCVAVENHQDATSDDLLFLAERVHHSPYFGVTLDAGNPLAVGEDPVEFATRIAPIIRHIHLKDYTIHFAPEGYRLVRCAAGDGVIDFPALLDIVHDNGHEVLPSLESAAQATRTIPLLESDWWDGYPPTPSTRLIPALRLLWEKGRPADEPYSSAWERGADSATVREDEWEVVRRSVDYFRRLTLD